MPVPTISLYELRQRAQKSQQQVAASLCISRSAYSKLERGLTELTKQRICQLAHIFKVLPSVFLPMPTPNPAEIGAAAAELAYLRATAEHSVLDAYIRASGPYEERIPFDELDEYCWDYLAMCDIKTREEYEAAGMLIARPAAGSEQLAFEQILRDPGIYSLFQHGIIDDEFLLKFWKLFQAKSTPYFEFESKPFGAVVNRLLVDERVSTPNAALLSSWPEPLIFNDGAVESLPAATQSAPVAADYVSAHPPVNWTEIVQESEARDLAWRLEELVFHEAEPVFAPLRDDSAAYAHTLARLAGLAWVMESLAEDRSTVDVLHEEAAQLRGEGYSSEFQAACEQFLVKQRHAYRGG